MRDARVAYTGTNLAFPLAGQRLANRVAYVNVAGAPGDRLHDFGPPGDGTAEPAPYRRGASADVWLANLRATRTQVLFVAALYPIVRRTIDADRDGFPIERAWADARPDVLPPALRLARPRASTRWSCRERARDRAAALRARRRCCCSSPGRCLVPMDETDLFFNLRLGEIVLHDHAVPRTNLLSFTYPDARDVNLAWLFQIVLALAHRAGGIPGTLLLKTAFVLATIAVLFRVALRRGAHPAAAALALALSAWAAEPRFVERPHLVTFLGLALTLLALERAEAGRPRALYALVPCGLVWANANSCFFLAPLVLALYALGARLDGRRADARRAGARAPLALVPADLRDAVGRARARLHRQPLAHALAAPAGGIRARALARQRARRLRRRGRPRSAAALPRAAAGATSLPVVAAGPAGRAPHPLPRRVRAAVRRRSSPCALDRRRRVALRRACPQRRAPTLPRSRRRRRRRCWPAPRSCRASRAARHGGRVFDLGMDPTWCPTAAIAFADRQRPARPDVQRHGGRLVPDLGGLAAPPRVPGPAHQRLPARVPRAAAPRRSVAAREWDALLAGFGVTTALRHLSRPEPARGVLRSRALGAGLPRRRRPGVRPRARPEFARAGRPRRAPGDVQLRPRDAGVDAAAARSRARAASPVADCEWQRRLGDFFVETARRHARASAAYRRRARRPGLPRRRRRCIDGRHGAGRRRAAPARSGDRRRGLRRHRSAARAHATAPSRCWRSDGPREALDEARRALAARPRGRRRAARRTPRARAPGRAPAADRFCFGGRQR